jgi:hypothetical protein
MNYFYTIDGRPTGLPSRGAEDDIVSSGLRDLDTAMAVKLTGHERAIAEQVLRSVARKAAIVVEKAVAL